MNTWYVSTTGNDSNSGSSSSPFLTVQRASDSASSGDRILLFAGTYPGNGRRSIINAAGIELATAPGEAQPAHMYMDPENNNDESTTLWVSTSANNFHAHDLELSGGKYYAIKLNADWYTGGGESEPGVGNVLLEDLNIHDTGRDAIKMVPKVHSVQVLRCSIDTTGVIYPPGTPQDDRNADGIDMVGVRDVLIQDCTISNTSTTGTYFKGGSRNVIIERCRYSNLGSHGISVGFDTSPEFFDLADNPEMYEAIDCIVRNNYINVATYGGITPYASKNCKVYNNTIVATGRIGHAGIYYGITLQDGGSDGLRPTNVNCDVKNNLVIQRGSDTYAVGVGYVQDYDLAGLLPGDAMKHDNNIYYNPDSAVKFYDNRRSAPANCRNDNEFTGCDLATYIAFEHNDANSLVTAVTVDATGHIPDGSAAIGRGATLTDVVDDIDAEARTVPYDIGCDQHGTGGSPPPPPPPPANLPPLAAFTSVSTGLSVQFTDGSSDPDGTIASRSWDFGDGGTSTDTSPNHVYTVAGTFNVTLQVTDNEGAPNSVTHSVTVSDASNPPPPPGDLDVTFSADIAGLHADFYDNTVVPAASITGRRWDNGDGTGSDNNYRTPSHTYAAAGTYTVTLTDTASNGDTGSQTQQVVIGSGGGNPPPPPPQVCTNAHPTDTPLCPDGMTHETGGTWQQAAYPDCSWTYVGGVCSITPPPPPSSETITITQKTVTHTFDGSLPYTTELINDAAHATSSKAIKNSHWRVTQGSDVFDFPNSVNLKVHVARS